MVVRQREAYLIVAYVESACLVVSVEERIVGQLKVGVQLEMTKVVYIYFVVLFVKESALAIRLVDVVLTDSVLPLVHVEQTEVADSMSLLAVVAVVAENYSQAGLHACSHSEYNGVHRGYAVLRNVGI
ncbi:MAG: hypothetical protein NVS4B12_10290 [Ktedonobacteraceae bacterium]